MTAASPDGQILASGSHPAGAVQLWRVGECGSSSEGCGTLLRTLEGHAHGVWSVAFSPDGQTLASGSLDQTVRLWQVTGCDPALSQAEGDQSGACGTLLHTLPGHSNGVISVAFSPHGQTLAVGAWDNDTVWLWRVSECDSLSEGCGAPLHTLDGGTALVTSVAFSPDGQTLAAGSHDGTVQLWDLAAEDIRQ